MWRLSEEVASMVRLGVRKLNGDCEGRSYYCLIGTETQVGSLFWRCLMVMGTTIRMCLVPLNCALRNG